jgi:hypothetical protein
MPLKPQPHVSSVTQIGASAVQKTLPAFWQKLRDQPSSPSVKVLAGETTSTGVCSHADWLAVLFTPIKGERSEFGEFCNCIRQRSIVAEIASIS